jgi:hypothetical protein
VLMLFSRGRADDRRWTAAVPQGASHPGVGIGRTRRARGVGRSCDRSGRAATASVAGPCGRGGGLRSPSNSAAPISVGFGDYESGTAGNSARRRDGATEEQLPPG